MKSFLDLSLCSLRRTLLLSLLVFALSPAVSAQTETDVPPSSEEGPLLCGAVVFFAGVG